MLGIITFGLIFILAIVIIWYCWSYWFSLDEGFLNIPDSQLYQIPDDKEKPVEIKYQVPIAQNQLTDLQLQSLDTDILRNVRTLANFSLTDELDFYQMYNLIKHFRDAVLEFSYNPTAIIHKSQVLEKDKLIELNTGAINNVDLELFSRLKMELISAFNNRVIRNGYYLPFHQYQFFKIINSNLISQDDNTGNWVFTLTIGREFKYQQFVLYWDVTLSRTGVNGNSIYRIKVNKIELIGMPVPKTIEFHENRKTVSSSGYESIEALLKAKEMQEKEKKEKLDIYRDQVSDSQDFDVQPIGNGKLFQSPNMKFIDVMETSDLDPSLFNANSQTAMVENKIMNQARDQQFHNHRCYGLVDGISKELIEYNDNPIFCKSYHPEISQNGIWDAPCQVNTDCPFYQANKNYPNESGKCNKVTGKCEMPLGVIPIGFTKYGKLEPMCYNCGMDSTDNKCCGEQAKNRALASPDYIFKRDEANRRQYANELEKKGLKPNPSI